jgi:hypothetical protein
MTIDEIVRDIHALEADLENYERKYGILSETFYEAYSMGAEPADDAWVLDCVNKHELCSAEHNSCLFTACQAYAGLWQTSASVYGVCRRKRGGKRSSGGQRRVPYASAYDRMQSLTF